MRSFPLVPAVALTALAVASPLAAQAAGLVVRNPGVAQGISLGMAYGRGRPGATPDSGTKASDAIGLRGSLGLGPVAVSAVLARTWFGQVAGPARSVDEVAATASVIAFGGPLVPLSIAWQVGASRRLGGAAGSPWRGILGLGAGLTIPATVLSIKPWVAPRLEYRGGTLSGGHRVRAAFASGVDLGLLNGLGIQVEFDSRLGWDDGRSVRGIGVGLSHHFR